MSLQLFALVRRPAEGAPEIRGVFTTAQKAEVFDPILKGTWSTGPKMGWKQSHEGSLVSYSQIVPFFANEELKL